MLSLATMIAVFGAMPAIMVLALADFLLKRRRRP